MRLVHSCAPLRVSLLGGGTDYPEFFNSHRGCVFGGAIDKYCHVFIKQGTTLSSERYKIRYSRYEKCSRICDIQHPAIRAILKHYQVDEPLEIHVINDLPARTGLGSSSSFVVAFIAALRRYFHLPFSPRSLALEAIGVERDLLGEKVGWQDQIFAAFGGMNWIRFWNNDFEVQPYKFGLSRFSENAFLIYTGIQRSTKDIVVDQVLKTSKGLNTLGLVEMAKLADVPNSAPDDGWVDGVVQAIDVGWRHKKSLGSSVSMKEIDDLIEFGLENGCRAAKLLGAGGGGFVLFVCDPERKQKIRQLFDKPILDFKFGVPGAVSKVVIDD